MQHSREPGDGDCQEPERQAARLFALCIMSSLQVTWIASTSQNRLQHWSSIRVFYCWSSNSAINLRIHSVLTLSQKS